MATVAKLQIVDSISATPTILADLNNRSPLFIMKDGWRADPPELNRSTSRSTLRDGETVSGSSYSDRVIEASIGVDADSAEAGARALQTVAKLLDRRGSWLLWQAVDMAKPVFFRAKRAEITEYDEFNGSTPFKVASLRIPADPFAYGEKVSGSFTVANDSFVHSWSEPVQGDVATPLFMSFDLPTLNKEVTTVASSIARSDGLVQSSPFMKSLASVYSIGLGSPWSSADEADSTAIGGTKRKVARSTSGSAATVSVYAGSSVRWVGLPQGEYRVMVRARLISGTDVSVAFVAGREGPPNDPTVSVTIRNAPSTGAGWDWYDLDVVSLPSQAPKSDVAFGLGPSAADPYWNLTVTSANAMELDLDQVLLLPVGSGPGVALARCSMSRSKASTVSQTVFLDGVSDQRYLGRYGLSAYRAFAAIAGALPELVPGAANTLHLMATTAVNDTGKGYADVKTDSYTVSFAYFPRYVGGFRPAAS
jgi:hypothetical protein